jgi:hypothetical protein
MIILFIFNFFISTRSLGTLTACAHEKTAEKNYFKYGLHSAVEFIFIFIL